MWYWDYIPSGWHHHKKPLTKAQLRKMQEAYKNADTISAEVKKKEVEEQEKTEEEMDEMMGGII